MGLTNDQLSYILKVRKSYWVDISGYKEGALTISSSFEVDDIYMTLTDGVRSVDIALNDAEMDALGQAIKELQLQRK